MANYSPEELIALSIAFMILPIVAAALRVWAIRIKKAVFYADDHLIFVALAGLIALCSMTIYGAIYGDFGRHQELGPGGTLVFTLGLEMYYKCDFVILLLSIVTVGISKISLLLLYHRIFIIPAMKITAKIGIIISVFWTMAWIFITIFQCKPVQYFWEEVTFDAESRCLDPITVIEAQVVTDILLDFAILVLPIPVIWKLHLPLRQRLSLLGLFLLGLLAISAGIAKIIVFFSVSSVVTKDLTALTYLSTPVFIWTVIEASLSLTCASLPTLKPIFIRSTFKARHAHAYYPSDASSNSSTGRLDVDIQNRKLSSSNAVAATGWIDLELNELYEEVVGDEIVQIGVDSGIREGIQNQATAPVPACVPGPRNWKPLPPLPFDE